MPSDRQSVQTRTYSPASATSLAMRASRSEGGSRPVTDSTRTLAGRALAQLAGHVVGGVHEAAEDDRAESRP